MSVVGKVFCKIINNRLVECLDKEGLLHEGQAGFRVNRSCMDNIFTLNELMQGRMREDKQTYAFFLDIKLMIQCGVMVCGVSCGIWV